MTIFKIFLSSDTKRLRRWAPPPIPPARLCTKAPAWVSPRARVTSDKTPVFQDIFFFLDSFRHLESFCPSSGKAVICHVPRSESSTATPLLEPAHSPRFTGFSQDAFLTKKPRCSREKLELIFTYPSRVSAVVGKAEWKKALI